MPSTARPTFDTDASPFEVDKYAAGDHISDKYRLEEPLGFGAMGMLWRAHNEALDAPVALKLIRKDTPWPWSAERLLREARVMASLRHAAIVRVFDYGTSTRHDPFIVMELLRGETLRELLDRVGALSAADAIRLLLPILEGLECAHARGIVHRDLKPENIFISLDDRSRIEPKLLDFGIAQQEGVASRSTTGGVLLGSPAYMSPEQAQGSDQLDARVDVWAAGVVLYEMIAGHEPWEAANCPALLRAIVQDDAPSILGVGGVDERLWSIFELALAKRRENRWASCREFRGALLEWLLSRSATALVRHHDSPAAEAAPRRTAPTAHLFRFAMVSAAAVSAFLLLTGLRRSDAVVVVQPSPNAWVQPMNAVAASAPQSTPHEEAVTDAPATPVAPSPTSSAVARRARHRRPAPVTRDPAVAPVKPTSAQTMDFGF
jgi:serine/threonine-protein kinase